MIVFRSVVPQRKVGIGWGLRYGEREWREVNGVSGVDEGLSVDGESGVGEGSSVDGVSGVGEGLSVIS